MIDISRTREQMLREIAAPAALAEAPSTDPETLGNDEAAVVLEGDRAPELLSRLYPLVRRRHPDVADERLERDLMAPLKKAVGNAWKHGNRKDPAKRITVTLIATGRGLVVEVRDQGEGFDIADVLERQRSERKYFNHHGSGFKHFQRARSLMSYTDFGRTFLLRFLRDDAVDDASGAGDVPDAEAMRTALETCFKPLRAGLARIVSCSRLPDHDLPGSIDAAYLLEIAYNGTPQRVVLSARAVSEGQARAERASARRLRRALAAGDALTAGVRPIRIPRPIAAMGDPGVVLYRLTARHDLRDHLLAADAGTACEVVSQVGMALRRLHGVSIDAPTSSPRHEVERQQRVFETARAALDRKAPDRGLRAQACFDECATRLEALGEWPAATIHGTFGWNVLLGDGVDFHLIGFDGCRTSHPGIDVGGFLLDMRRILLLRAKADPSVYPLARAAFERAYFADGRPDWIEHLDLFIAFAMPARLERLLRRSEKKWEAKVDGLLEDWAQLLHGGEITTDPRR